MALKRIGGVVLMLMAMRSIVAFAGQHRQAGKEIRGN